jgi:hypothetical protein
VGKEEQLEWERRWAPYAAGAAFLAGALALAAFLYQRSISPAAENYAQSLVSIDQQPGKYLLDAGLSALSSCLIAVVLYYLYRAIKFRRDLIPRLALILALAAPVAYGGLLMVSTAHQVSIAHDFVRNEAGAKQVVVGAKTDKKEDDRKGSLNDRAKDKLSGSAGLAGASFATTLAISIAFVLISLNATRAGLLSRFTGSLGMVVGALYVFQIIFRIPPGLVEAFWLPTVGLMVLDKWPQGRGPAWDAGEAIPWPTAEERRAAAAGEPVPQRPARPSGGLGALFRPPRPVEEPDAGSDSPDPEPQRTRAASRPQTASSHPRSKKKKRKRRG